MSPEKRKHTTVRLPESVFDRLQKVKRRARGNEILQTVFTNTDNRSELIRLVIERGLQFLEAEAYDSTAYIRVGGQDIGSLVALYSSLRDSMNTVGEVIQKKGYNLP